MKILLKTNWIKLEKKSNKQSRFMWQATIEIWSMKEFSSAVNILYGRYFLLFLSDVNRLSWHYTNSVVLFYCCCAWCLEKYFEDCYNKPHQSMIWCQYGWIIFQNLAWMNNIQEAEEVNLTPCWLDKRSNAHTVCCVIQLNLRYGECDRERGREVSKNELST